LVKRGRHSKFAPKAVEEFLLGYDSNTKAYRVFNKYSGLVKVTMAIGDLDSNTKAYKNYGI
jgi:thiamine pyrophosphokinase